MPFTLQQRYQILTLVNLALLRSQVWRDEAEQHFYAPLGVTQQAKIPTFEEADIFGRLDKLEQKSEFLVTKVLAVVQKLKDTETEIEQAQGTNHALKKADVLEWDVDLKLVGLFDRRDALSDQLFYFLGLPLIPKPHDSGILGRS